ncbi:ABC transporter ATP-binding protein [Butyrivibrio sp. VCD2006]|uniref:ABC transporter ATP-binding protein n=1 Tax=Butyrivibrio sp. VCD2006 TaxID=1280664 RepID=UPI00040C944F|nr:ABC transporter ATP-binding protein [Butyrivibrio sp. VCD2006]
MIQVKNLTFSYTKKPFIQDMNFEVEEGEIFGFLGPSGAGKSTLQKILLGMLPGYQGSAVVGGVECSKHDAEFYQDIGVDFEYSTMYEKLTAKENLEFFSSLYDTSGKTDGAQGGKKKRDLDELFAAVGLENDAEKRVSDYSKGMKSRLNFIKALVHEPKLLFLDEPTSGLDPANSRLMKDMILEEKRKGKTILLTTHNMQDAAELCDRVAFIVGGQIYALDTPHNLIMSKGAAKVTYTWLDDEMIEHSASCDLLELSQDKRLKNLIAENRLQSIHSSEPTLNDIFIEITGRTLV